MALAMGSGTAGTVVPEARAWRPTRWLGAAILMTLVALIGLRAEMGTRLDGFTIDEPWHIVAGASYARTGDFRLNPEHPPLAKLWVGLWMPERLLQLPEPAVLTDKPQERDLVETAVYNQADVDALQARARLAMMVFNALLLLAVAGVCWVAFGWWPAVIVLGLVLIEPTVLAHMPLVMTDLPVALTLSLAALVAGWLAWRWQWRWALGAGVAIGLALASKHSAIPGVAAIGLGLVVAALLAWRDEGWRAVLERLVKVCVVVLVSAATIWMSYGFQFNAGPDGSDHYNRPLDQKIADLQRPWTRTVIQGLDQARVLPRPYLWGLADTVRAGVDGRGASEHRLWGIDYPGRPPLHAWPSLIASKLPLALMALLVLGIGLLAWRRPGPGAWRPVTGMLLAMALGYMAALLYSKGTYAGIRHALPVVMVLLILASVGLSRLWTRASVVAVGVVAMVWLLAVGVTLREPRLYEFHNTLAGGSDQAWRYFRNESVDLGQRMREIGRFHDTHVVPSGEPMYLFYWIGDRPAEHYVPTYSKLVPSIHDESRIGEWEGWFAFRMSSTLPEPRMEWDPEEIFAEMTLVERVGHVGIWRGRLAHPRMWAGSMSMRVWEYMYIEGGQDWDLVARRLDQVLEANPLAFMAAFELGNARLRLGQREAALAAYRYVLEQTVFPVDPVVLASLAAHVQRVEASEDLAMVEPMRNPFSE